MDRLLLAPIGSFLLCAAFPDDGILNLPTHQPPREIRKLKRKAQSDEQLQEASIAQDAEVSVQGDSNPSGSLFQEDAPAQHQETSVDRMDVDEEQEQDDGETDADCESDSSDN